MSTMCPTAVAAAESVSCGIVNSTSDREIVQMFTDTEIFRESILKWKHPEIGVNIFQFAIIHNRNYVLQFLGCRFPEFLNEKEIYVNRNTKTCASHSDILENSPLHLACWVGSLDVVKYLISNSVFSVTDGSVITLEKICTSKNRTKKLLFKRSENPVQNIKKPFDVCVSEEHLDCAIYLLENLILPTRGFVSLYPDTNEHSSFLHMACSLGNSQLVSLLLKPLPKCALHMVDSSGKTPLHIAVFNGNTETIQQLLEAGAECSTATQTQNCLHFMYRSCFNLARRAANTALLIKHGVRVNEVDSSGDTCLHVLAEQLHLDISEIKMAKESVCEEITRARSDCEVHTLDVYHRNIALCIQLLVNAGADVRIRNAKGDTAFEVLLKTTSVSSSLNIPIVYRAAELLVGDTSHVSWSRFIKNHLSHQNRRKDKLKIVALLCQHGADVDQMESADSLVTRLLYPVCIAVNSRVDVECLEMMFNYMSNSHLNHAICHLCSRVLPGLLARASFRVVYADKLADLVRTVPTRSLRHACKITVLVCLGRQPSRCSCLPLPQILKHYIMSSEF